MLSILKYSIFIIIFFLLIFVYFFFTSSGNQQLYGILDSKLSNEIGLDVEVESINIQQYPYLEAAMLIDGKYNLKVKGYLEDDHLDMDYKLTSNCIQSNICTIDDEIDVSGHMNGPLEKVHITGEGKALDGNVSYLLTKESELYKDVNFSHFLEKRAHSKAKLILTFNLNTLAKRAKKAISFMR